MAAISEKRSIRGTVISKVKDGQQQKYYHSQQNLAIIYQAAFQDIYLLTATKLVLTVYDSIKMIKILQINVVTHSAVFIPQSNYLAFVGSKDGINNVLVLWDYINNIKMSQVVVKFQIQCLKASRRCILMVSLDQLYVIHFPSLKPIYNGNAGNGFSIVCDMSRQGLTLVHSTDKKGEVMIRNFTNIQTNKLLVDIRSRSRGMTFKSHYTQMKPKLQQIEEEQTVKAQINIIAHSQNVMILKLSPNGYRMVSGSAKGTVIRLFSCLNGELISQYHMSNQLSLIIDITFMNEGNAIACLNDLNQVNLFHTKMSELELMSETARKGKEVYQKENPKAFFSFLGFLNEDLNYERPFAYFTLTTKSIQQKQKQNQHKFADKSKQKSPHLAKISEIKQQAVNLQMSSFVVPSKTSQEQEVALVKTFNYQNENKGEVKLQNKFSQSVQKINNVGEKDKSKERQSRISTKKKLNQSSLKSINLQKRQTEMTVTIRKQQKNLNFKGIIYFDNATNLKILRSKYYYKLKYDPFNGGTMIEADSFDLLNHPLFRNI